MSIKSKKILMAFVGTVGASACVGFLQKAEMGVDPYTCFVTGWCNLTGLSFMNMFIVCTVFLLFIMLLTGRKYLGIGTIFNLILGGTISAFTRYMLDRAIPDPALLQRTFLLIFALVFVGFASALYTTAEMGVSTYDAVSLIMSERYKLAAYYKCRMITDIACILFGFGMHVTIGIGTILTGFCMGPCIQWFRKYVAEKILNEKNK